MDHTFKLTRTPHKAGSDDRSASIVADADKLVKQYQMRHRGSHARLNEGDGEHVTATVSIPEDADESTVLRVFEEDAARLALTVTRV
ncbi:MAG: hypothetical protein ABI843_12690 [Dokdonella sp.]